MEMTVPPLMGPATGLNYKTHIQQQWHVICNNSMMCKAVLNVDQLQLCYHVWNQMYH